MKRVYILVLCTTILAVFGCHTKRNIVKFDDFIIDSVYFIQIEYFSSQGHPYYMSSFLKINNECKLDLTNLDSLKSSLQSESQFCTALAYELPIYDMIKSSLADSSEQFKREIYWYHEKEWWNYYKKRPSGQVLSTKTDVKLYFEIALISGILHEMDDIVSVAVIKDIMPVLIDNSLIVNGNMITLSKKTLIPYKQKKKH